MKDAILFLSGRYQARDFPIFERLARGKFRVAVDGGYRFFVRSGLRADLVIGDFDSLGRRPAARGGQPDVLDYPRDKDKTDAELAVDYCLERGMSRIDIVQPGVGEPDHFLANVLLLSRSHRKARRSPRASIRLVGPNYEARYLADQRLRLTGAVGSRFSILPLSKTIRYSCRGTAFDVVAVRIRRGETRATRNRVTSDRATVEVSGEALLWRRFGPREKP